MADLPLLDQILGRLPLDMREPVELALGMLRHKATQAEWNPIGDSDLVFVVDNTLIAAISLVLDQVGGAAASVPIYEFLEWYCHNMRLGAIQDRLPALAVNLDDDFDR